MSWPVLHSVQPSPASCNYSNFTDCCNWYICNLPQLLRPAFHSFLTRHGNVSSMPFCPKQTPTGAQLPGDAETTRIFASPVIQFVPQAKNAANEATERVCVGCCGAWSASERSQLRELAGSTLDSLHKNLAWWAVTRETVKTVKNGGGRLPRTIHYKIIISPCLTG